MANKKIVVALGRNAFSESFPKQQERVKLAAKAIADLVEEKYDVVITHSNGPQVGMIQTAMTEFSRLDPDRTVAPMSICSAMSQGYIGFDLQNAIRSELLSRGLYKPVSTIITQVRVDPFDRAFNAPSKVIGRLMTKEEAENEKKKGNYVEYEEGDEGYRRIIASPKPIDIYEIDAIKALVDADALMILTSSDNLTIDLDGEVKELGTLTTKEAEELIDKGYFDPITSLPKIDASLNFVLAKKGRKAIISNLAKAKDAIRGKIGTVIE